MYKILRSENIFEMHDFRERNHLAGIAFPKGYTVDVVLNRHDHIYERFAPQTPDGIADPVRGIREFVVGTGEVTTPHSRRMNGCFENRWDHATRPVGIQRSKPTDELSQS